MRHLIDILDMSVAELDALMERWEALALEAGE